MQCLCILIGCASTELHSCGDSWTAGDSSFFCLFCFFAHSYDTLNVTLFSLFFNNDPEVTCNQQDLTIRNRIALLEAYQN